MIIGGFVVDIFTLNRIDQLFDNAILVTHLLIVGISIALLFSKDTHFGDKVLKLHKSGPWIFSIMMFSFGGVFSGFFLFYTRSGSFIASAPFIALMLLLMLGAEFLKKYYQKLTLQVAIFYVAVFAYLIFFVPLITNTIGSGMFLLSGILSLIVIGAYLVLLQHIDTKNFLLYRNKFLIAIASICLGFNALYFTNIIPPVPLSLKFNAAYHNVQKLEPSGYAVTYEPAPRYRLFKKESHRLHWVPGQPIYVFTAIFAPGKITTTVYHRWDHFDRDQGWVTTNTIPIAISAGRDEGFRGYSMKTNLAEGNWRVAVTNNRGQVLGYVRFKLIETNEPPRVLLDRI